jgi:Family of unknown function (DUF6297)
MLTAGAEPAAIGSPAVPGGPLRRRLRASSRTQLPARTWLARIYEWIFAAAMLAALGAGALRPVWRYLSGPGSAAPPSPSRLFLAATLLLVFSAMIWTLRMVGPIGASSAIRFWLLSAPVRRRDLLRPRFLVLIFAVASVAALIAIPIAHAASAAALPTIAAAIAGAITVATASVWGQASDAVDRALHGIGQALGAVSIVGFGSLATGFGRMAANSALRAPPDVIAALLAALLIAAVACAWGAYRALDRIDVSVLSRSQGLWTAGHAAISSLDVFMLSEFVTEQRARATGRVRSALLGPRYAGALIRAEWARIRRQPGPIVGAVVVGLVWWGCRPVLSGPALACLALVGGYCVVLPMTSTLRQLAASPGLRSQFAPHDRGLAGASTAVCVLAALLWAAVVLPGIMPWSATVAVILVLGLIAAVYRTVTRPALDYSAPPVMTPLGPLPLELWRQVVRGPLLLLMLLILVLITAR